MLYKIVESYIKAGIFLFYKKVKVIGKENIPKKGPILFVANHQNAMMDPLVLATSVGKSMYFLARASAFKNKIAGKLLNKLHAIAIYRKRDGVDSAKLNEAVFDHCLQLLNEEENMLIFPEGSHNIVRKLRSLRAGFTRMTLDYLKTNPSKDLIIVPVGLNYDNTIDYAKSLHIVIGKPISTRAMYDEKNEQESIKKMLDEVHQKIASLTVYIDDEKNYGEIVSSLNEKEFLTPKLTNDKIISSKFNFGKMVSKVNPKNIFYYLMMLNSLMPFAVWNWLKPKIDAIEFTSTAKFSLGLTVFPFFYWIQTLIVKSFFGSSVAWLYIGITFLLVILATKTRKTI